VYFIEYGRCTLHTFIVSFVLFYLFTLHVAFQYYHGLGSFILEAVVGWYLWVIVEYYIHRFIYHHQNLPILLNYISHGYHHIFPRDKTRIISPPIFSISILFFIKYMFAPYFHTIMVGLVPSYCFYEYTHYMSHCTQEAPEWLRNCVWFKQLKQNHLVHHYHYTTSHQQTNGHTFGVTHTILDYVCGTTKENMK
jgi:hypothetical protein